VVPLLSDPASQIKSFPWRSRWGNMGSAMTNASKEETAPAGIAIASFKQGFHPGTSASPKNRRKQVDLSHPCPHHRHEESQNSLPMKGMRRPLFHLHHRTDWAMEVQSTFDTRPVTDTTTMPGGRSCQAPPRPLQPWNQHHSLAPSLGGHERARSYHPRMQEDQHRPKLDPHI
jgi:hypothetical protein